MTQQFIGGNSFDAAGWTGTGFGAGEALEVGIKFGRITDGLDQSSIAGIESLDFNSSAQGIVGGPDDGELTFDADDSVLSRVRNAGRTDLFLKAGGPNNKVENIHTGHPLARTRLKGGEFETASVSSGAMTATGVTVIDEFYGLGGKTVINHGASVMAFAELVGGETTIKRKVTKFIVGAGAILNLDPDSSIDWSTGSVVIEIYGGLVRWFGGSLPSIKAIGGAIDFRFARGAIGSALGATKFDVAGTQILSNPDVNLTNMNDLGAIFRSENGPVQFSGSRQSVSI